MKQLSKQTAILALAGLSFSVSGAVPAVAYCSLPLFADDMQDIASYAACVNDEGESRDRETQAHLDELAAELEKADDRIRDLDARLREAEEAIE